VHIAGNSTKVLIFLEIGVLGIIY